MGKLNVDVTEIQVLQIEEDDYVILTDMVRKERLIKLNKIAIHQMSILEEQTTKVLK